MGNQKKGLIDEYTSRNAIKDLTEGMGSVFDLSGGRHFNSFINNFPPSPTQRIGGYWINVGQHLSNAMKSFSEDNNLPHPTSFSKKSHF